MIALGFWAGALGGRATRRLPLTFLSAMVLGFVLAELNFNFPMSETVTVASTVLISVLALLRLELPNIFFLALGSLLAAVHGYAHAVDLSVRTLFLPFGAGFAAATAVLLLGGILLAYLTSKTEVRAPRTTS
jgi:urease accessory protein